MHICIVTTFFYPLLNGVSVRVYKDAQALKKAGHKVSIISPHKGITEFDCYQTGRPPVFLSLSTMTKILSLNKANKIDCVISHSYISDIFSWLPAKIIKAKFIRQVHGPEWLEIKKTAKGGVKKIISYVGCLIDNIIIKRADKYIVVEKELGDWLQQEFEIDPKKITWIANYPDLAIFKPEAVDKDKFTVGYLGTLQPGRISPLLNLSQKLNQVKFIVAGSGEGKNEIKKFKNIELTQETDYDKIPQLISKFNIGVIFSLTPQGMSHKGPPMKLFEYLACGVPVLAVNLRELKDIIEKNKVGLIVTEKELEQGVLKIKKDWNEFQANVLRFREKMVQSYDWKNEKEKLLEVVKSCS